MNTMFNRRELMTTSDIDRQSDIRRRLSAHHIDYVIKNPAASSLDPYRQQSAYIFFVKKSDYEEAMAVIQDK
jgi:hypothetical protein